MTGETVKKDRNVLYLIIYCMLAALGWIIPPIAPITAEGMHLLGVFVAAIFAWSVTPALWPSLMTFLLLPFTGLIDLNGVLAMSWGSDTVLFMIFLMPIITFMEESGTTAYMASWLMSRKMLNGHPWRLIGMILLVAFALSTLCSYFPGMLITWSFIYQICAVLGYKPFDKFPNLLIFGVTIMAALSLSSMPWHFNALVILGAFTQSTGIAINAVHYICYTLPVAMLCILGYLLLCKYVFRLDVSRLKKFDANMLNAKGNVLTKECKMGFVALIALIVILLVPSILPPTNPVRIISDKMGLSLKGAILVMALSFLKVDGKQIFHFEKLVSKGIPWNMVFMIIGILCFVGLLGSDATGISKFLAFVVSPIFANTSPVVFMLLVLLITVVLTNFMINMVVAVIVMSVTLPIAVSLGISPIQIIYLITLSCTIAFMLPPASAASCVLFANKQWVRPKDVYVYSIPTIIMMSAIALIWNLVLFMF